MLIIVPVTVKHCQYPHVFDILSDLAEPWAIRREIDTICGYRTPWSNGSYACGRQVAEEQPARQAHAIDIRIPVVDNADFA